jgi:hypothetical protein
MSRKQFTKQKAVITYRGLVNSKESGERKGIDDGTEGYSKVFSKEMLTVHTSTHPPEIFVSRECRILFWNLTLSGTDKLNMPLSGALFL